MDDSAELFEAISHPVRIKILKILEKQPVSFASLKRQLSIESSGNLDHHLKKLTQLIKVREDGLYDLTDAGKEALLSIEAIDLWKEKERHKIMPLEKVPGEAFVLALLEFGTAAVAAYTALSAFSAMCFTAIVYSGFLPSAVVLLLGFSSTFGVLSGKAWSWKAVIVKSALTMFQSLILLYYLILLWNAHQDISAGIVTSLEIAVAFIAAEAVSVLLALRRPVKEFLGVQQAPKSSRRALVGGTMSIISAALTILAGSTYAFSSSPYGGAALGVLGFMTFASGLTVGIGGVLILLRNQVSGALMSIIFGLFPSAPAYYSALMLVEIFGFSIVGIIAALVVGSLPIAGGILALANKRKI